MSYAAVSTLTVKDPDGGVLALVDVPVEDIIDTVAAKAVLALPGVTGMLLAQLDAYAMTSAWPALRAEVDRATAEATAQARSSAAKLAVGAAIGLTVLAAGAYLLHGRRP
jgi:hypothetical protein